MSADLKTGTCEPCESGIGKLAGAEIRTLMSKLPEWELASDATSINRYVKCKNFKTALEMVNRIGEIAEKNGHHPDLGLGWGYLDITLTTHAVDGLTKNDFIVAAQMDEVIG